MESEATPNFSYFKTGPGIVMIVELIFEIICLISAMGAWMNIVSVNFLLFVVITCFTITLISVVCYVFRQTWGRRVILAELIYTAVASGLFLVAGIIHLAVNVSSYYNGYVVTAGVFALFNCLAYGVGCFLIFIKPY